ncbi:MAG TPA: outer membrane lipoprotein-sorting protein [Thermoanaerobaculia bacterium]|nr:outer membrane lipoprotein-sorting protein [Thermoanaerobaculia bacterium]
MKTTLLVLLALSAAPLLAADGAAILARVDHYRAPLESFAIDVEIVSRTKQKSETSRFRVYGSGSDRSLVEFTFPQGEKGKRLLMLRDAMWIYMPAASRPIRISPLQRLMGQASNGDVARTSFAVDYEVRSAADEEWEGKKTTVLDLEAKDSGVAYHRVRLWVDRSTSEPLRADFYVASGKLIKRAFYREMGQMAGRRVPIVVEIEDLLRPGDGTTMRYSNLVARDNPEKMFSKDSLGKW